MDLIHTSIIQGKICPYCLNETEYVDSSAVYKKSYGMIYWCKACDAYVGVHKGTDRALGRLANAELRYWKKAAHACFDPLWKQDLNKGEPKHIVRNRQYKWLSEQLQIELSETHIGWFDVDLCKKVVECCKDLSLKITPPVPATIAAPAQLRPFTEFIYRRFQEKWVPEFQKKLGADNIWFDEKKLCFTLRTSEQLYDYYPKADKILHQNQKAWINQGLQWLMTNLLQN